MRIANVLSSAIATYDDWNGFLINPRYIRDGFELTWADREAGIYEPVIRQSNIISLSNRRQYTFQLRDDGALIQLYYRFDRLSGELSRARLAYFASLTSSVHEITSPDDREAFEAGLLDLPVPTFGVDTLDPPVSWLRIDYDPLARQRGVIHPDCHLHFSSFPECRFVVRGVPSPRQFLEFVIATVYPDQYKRHRLKPISLPSMEAIRWEFKHPQQVDELNTTSMPLPDDELYRRLPHLLIPHKS